MRSGPGFSRTPRPTSGSDAVLAVLRGFNVQRDEARVYATDVAVIEEDEEEEIAQAAPAPVAAGWWAYALYYTSSTADCRRVLPILRYRGTFVEG